MNEKPQHSSKPILKIRNLKFKYPEQKIPILNGIDLKLYPHEVRVIVGPSGCGKSTLASAICGFIPHSIEGDLSGTININGKFNIHRNIYEISKDIALVQQDAEAQLCSTDVFHELAFALENFRRSETQIIKRVDQVLKQLGILQLKGRSIHTLSGGEKQKVAIGSMLVLNPKIMIFDEPTANLDPQAAKGFIELIDKLRNRTKIGILIVDHNPAQYYKIADHILVMKKGIIEHVLSSHQYIKFNSDYYLPVFNKAREININLPNGLSYQKGSTTNKKMKFQSETNGKNLLRLNNISFNYGHNKILKNISFSIKKGEFIALMGANGSGKTTLIQNIIKLLSPSKGAIVYNLNQANNLNRPRYRKTLETPDLAKKIGFVFQNPNHMIFGNTVWDEVMLGPQNLFKDPNFAKKNAEELLRIGDLLDYKKTHPLLLSHGEKRRVNLASILCYDPQIIILDEPFIGQDPDNISKILDYLLNLVSRGKSILMVTHRADIVQKYCTRLLFLKEGNIILDQEPKTAFDTLSKNGEHSYIPINFGDPGGEIFESTK
jgi:energy-coupling factor transport system ATP-binding protein